MDKQFWELWLESFKKTVSTHGAIRVYIDLGLINSLKEKNAG